MLFKKSKFDCLVIYSYICVIYKYKQIAVYNVIDENIAAEKILKKLKKEADKDFLSESNEAKLRLNLNPHVFKVMHSKFKSF